MLSFLTNPRISTLIAPPCAAAVMFAESHASGTATPISDCAFAIAAVLGIVAAVVQVRS